MSNQHKPELELDPRFGGPNFRGRTAIGTESPDPSPGIPNWFRLFGFPIVSHFYKAVMQFMSTYSVREMSYSAMLSDEHRKILAIKWKNHKFNDPAEAAELLAKQQDLNELELEAVWKLWIYERSRRQTVTA